jgi:hypothetical protein
VYVRVKRGRLSVYVQWNRERHIQRDTHSTLHYSTLLYSKQTKLNLADYLCMCGGTERDTYREIRINKHLVSEAK